MTIRTLQFRAPVTGTSSKTPSIIVGSTTVGGEDTLLIADATAQQLAIETLNTLRKIEYHLSLMTDANLENL